VLDNGALIRRGIPPAYVAQMIDVAPPHPVLGQSQCDCFSSHALLPQEKGLKKHVNTQATSRSLRHLAREAAERGERLVEIARRLKIAPSTIHHWAREDGFRRKDVRARASLAHGPQLTGKADYPELKDMAPRARLERLGELSGEARLRAVAAIEEGYLDYGLKWLREAQKLERGYKALKEHLEHYPPPEEFYESEDDAWREHIEDEMAALEAGEVWVPPPLPPQTPKQIANAREDALIDAAIEAARIERMTEERDGRAPTPDEIGDDRVANFGLDVEEYWRLKEEVKKWRLFPGRGDPPPLRAVSRGRSILPQPEPEMPAGKKLYGMEDAFPVTFTRRE